MIFGLGSNLSPRLDYIGKALDAFRRRTSVRRTSSLLETTPHRMESNHRFLNMVLEVEPAWSGLEELKQWIEQTESALGRRREGAVRDRTIDIDLLFWGERIRKQPLTVPHPRLQERTFVLEPLAEIVPDLRHPGLDRTVRELQYELQRTQKRT